MTVVLALVCIMLVPFAVAGLALIHQGLGRSRSAAHSMLATMCVVAIAAICFITLGASFTGFAGQGASYSFVAGGMRWNWLGAEPWLMRGVITQGAAAASALPRSLVLCLEMFAAGLAASIPVSSGSDRWRLSAICCSAAVSTCFLFPLMAHWLWGGGWLSQFGRTFGIGDPLDAGGAGIIQVFGGFIALSTSWALRPRRGKYAQDGTPTAIPAHNIVQVLFGSMLALVGWIGLESASSLLFYGAAIDQVAVVVINAMLSASSGCLAAMVTTQIRYRKPDASLSANGWVAGLVAGSAACAYVGPAAAMFIGAVAGLATTLLVEVLELHLMIDDPGGSVSVHAGAGLWGLMAAGIFAHVPGTSRSALLLAQLIYISTCVGLLLPLIHGATMLLNKLVPFRVDGDGDWQGMDIRELGAGAYPEFVVHADEFLPR